MTVAEHSFYTPKLATEERFNSLWDDWLGVPVPADAYAEICAAYGSARRAYHTMQHLDEGLQIMDTMVEAGAEPAPAVEFAWWYHDYSHTPDGRVNDEVVSAVEAGVRMIRAGHYTLDVVARTPQVIQLVLMTKHRDQPKTPEEMLICDLDLAVFAANDERFMEYCLQVRREYSMIPESMYVARRISILTGFLKRPRIFRTNAMTPFEGIARRHLMEEIGRLKNG